ncbi:hypothetical protein KUM39_13905 [Streptomyces sp. J2-1]|uniref:hypothetical protein n=1 Tax=Streptomyces corallincola TaxID=2851888 RepID=UPI001C381A4E|nr:hypothetical protein [Streptomyces corallincola]MBV2355449.1 hypothetical protein [Streptomyces corallincola]
MDRKHEIDWISQTNQVNKINEINEINDQRDFCPVMESVRGVCSLSVPELDGSRW